MSYRRMVGTLSMVAGLSMGLAGLALAGEWADITPKRTGDYDANKGSGYCTIRVRVDIETIVHVRWDRVAFETMAGRASSDEGTECSQPLPNGNALANFRFRGVDGRGEQTLMEAPSASNAWTAKIRIRDTRGGDEGYTSRIEWDNRGGSSAWDTSGWGGAGSTGGGWGTTNTSANSGSTWGGSGTSVSEFTGSMAGNGRFELRNGAATDLTEARVDLRRNGEFLLELRGNNVYQDLSGRWIRRGNNAALEITQGFRNSGASGRGSIEFQGSQMVRVTVNGTDRRANNEFRADFRSGNASNSGWGNRPNANAGWGGNTNSNSNSGWGNTTSSNSGWGNTTSSNSGWGNTTSSNSGWGNSQSTAPGWGGTANIVPYVGTSTGTGTLSLANGRQMSLTEGRVEIRANGEALVQFRGQMAPSFSGRVENQTATEATIRVTQYDQAPSTGTLRVQVNSGQLMLVDGQIQGRRGGQVTVSFRR